MLGLKTIDKDGDRFLLWPISFAISDFPKNRWFQWHGWQVGSEVVSLEKTSRACIPGYRRVFGQTLSLGRLKVRFGKLRSSEDVDKWCSLYAPSTDR